MTTFQQQSLNSFLNVINFMTLVTKIKQTFLQKIHNGLNSKLIMLAASLVLATSGVGSISSCSDNANNAPSQNYGCKMDQDCKGDRICVQGECVFSNGNNTDTKENYQDAHSPTTTDSYILHTTDTQIFPSDSNMPTEDSYLQDNINNYGNLTCAEIATCDNSCEDNSCIESCIEQGTELAQDSYVIMISCNYDNNCAENTDTYSEYQKCFLENCRNELENCIGSTTGTMNCSQLVNCTNECLTNQTCEQSSCFYDATSEAQMKYLDIIICGELNNCTDSNCLNEYCNPEIYNCFNN